MAGMLRSRSLVMWLLGTQALVTLGMCTFEACSVLKVKAQPLLIVKKKEGSQEHKAIRATYRSGSDGFRLVEAIRSGRSRCTRYGRSCRWEASLPFHS